MGMVTGNEVQGALGVGILCIDHSMCEASRATSSPAPGRTRPPQDLSRGGYAIEAHYYAQATALTTTRSCAARAASAPSTAGRW